VKKAVCKAQQTEHDLICSATRSDHPMFVASEAFTDSSQGIILPNLVAVHTR